MVTQHRVTERAAGIMMNAKTGEILAMATVPGFNPNEPYTITNTEIAEYLTKLQGTPKSNAYFTELYAQWKNKAVHETYIPGSVFKVVTASATLEEQLADFNTSFNCPGMTIVSGVTIRCHRTSGHGTQVFKDALKNSCNPAFMEMGRRLGADKFYTYFKAFGMHEKTGIDLPGETSSIHYKAEDMGSVELATCAFGQGNKVTPIELVTAYAAVVNGGNLMTPYVVDRIVDNEGNVVLKNNPTVKRQAISEQTSAMMRESLEYVVNTNAGNAYIKGYHIGGKSGTSEKIDLVGSDTQMQYVASYGCFAPADNPEIILLVIADEPRGGEHFGSMIAAPCAKKILEEALPYLGFYPQYTQAELAALNVTVPNVVGATIDTAIASLTNSNLKFQTVGKGTTVIKQVPAKFSSMPKDGTVILYTERNFKEEEVVVPNVKSRTLGEANKILTDSGLNYTGLSMNPTATVQQQSPEPGTRVPKGTIIELTFMTTNHED
jgi:stage V sporulation protein D (sporulation-specific penicillin-binding protein)